MGVNLELCYILLHSAAFDSLLSSGFQSECSGGTGSVLDHEVNQNNSLYTFTASSLF